MRKLRDDADAGRLEVGAQVSYDVGMDQAAEHLQVWDVCTSVGVEMGCDDADAGWLEVGAQVQGWTRRLSTSRCEVYTHLVTWRCRGGGHVVYNAGVTKQLSA